MRINREDIFIPGEPTTAHITCIAVRQLFVFGGDEMTYEEALIRKHFIENTLWKLTKPWSVTVFSFSVMENHIHKVLRFDPTKVKLLTDLQIAELACDLDVKCERRGRFTPKQRANWINKVVSNKNEVEKWRYNFSSMSVFMQYFKEAISKFINRRDKTRGALWSDRYHATRIEDLQGLLASMQMVDLNRVRAGCTQNLEESYHSSIYYRMVDLHTLKEAEREHARKMKEMLCPFEEIPASCGASQEIWSFEDYLEMLTVEGCTERTGKCVPSHDPEALMLRYGLQLGWITGKGMVAFKQCRTAIGNIESMRLAALRLNKCWDKQIEALKNLFVSTKPEG